MEENISSAEKSSLSLTPFQTINLKLKRERIQ